MIERVLECVRETVGDFREHPWHYLYEEDFRAVLFAKLREKFTETIGPDPNKAGSESATVDQPGVDRSLDLSNIQTCLVHAEYPRYCKTNQFDIAVLDPDQHIEWKTLWEAKIATAIEIKVGSDRVGTDQCGGFKKDLKKLHDAIYGRSGIRHGLALYLYQTPPKNGIESMRAWFDNEYRTELIAVDDKLVSCLMKFMKNTAIGLVLTASPDCAILVQPKYTSRPQ
jgi:hypothetical protein